MISCKEGTRKILKPLEPILLISIYYFNEVCMYLKIRNTHTWFSNSWSCDSYNAQSYYAYTVHVIQAMLLPNSSDWMLKQRFYQGFNEQSLESVAIRFKIFALIQKRKIVGFVGTLEKTDWTHKMRPPISPSRVTTGCPLQVLLREIDCVILTAILTVWY